MRGGSPWRRGAAMKLETKDVSGALKQIEVPPMATVLEAKEAAAAAHGRAVKKLIFMGKVLEDDSLLLQQAGVTPEQTLIVMLEKKKKKRTPAAHRAAIAPTPQTSSGPAVAEPLGGMHERAGAVARLLALGVADSEETAVRALEMASGDIDRAAGVITGACVTCAMW